VRETPHSIDYDGNEEYYEGRYAGSPYSSLSVRIIEDPQTIKSIEVPIPPERALHEHPLILSLDATRVGVRDLVLGSAT
jgi:hypothetical protein